MKSFEWASPKSVDDAVSLLGKIDPQTDPDEIPRVMGGGQDLLTSMKAYIVKPPRVVNLKQIEALKHLDFDAKALRIGAAVTLADLHDHPEVIKNFPGLAEAAHSVATPQIRNMGTVGGNLCQRPRCWYFRLENYKCYKKGGEECFADNPKAENKYNAILGGGPSYFVHPSDLAPMLIALNSTLKLAGPDGARQVPLEEFFILPKTENKVRYENILKPGEIITEIIVPSSPMATNSTYVKFKERASLDFAISAVAAAVELAADESVKQARIVLGGVAPIPWRVKKAEDFLTGKKIGESVLAQTATLALDGAQPLSQNGYKVPLTKTLVKRSLVKLIA
jgi:xanthine dehydrogenase YagS FAD-binding subunit